MGLSLQFAASLSVGLLLGILNWALWANWVKGLIGQKNPKWSLLVARSLLKLMLLGIILWFGITKGYLTPGAFLIGFSLIVIALLLKGLKWN